MLLGKAEESAYKSAAAASMANGHAVIGFSNLDINLAKQIVILLTDFGVKKDDIVIDPLMAALGMGLEYSYSVNERIRLAAPGRRRHAAGADAVRLHLGLEGQGGHGRRCRRPATRWNGASGGRRPPLWRRCCPARTSWCCGHPGAWTWSVRPRTD